MVKAFTYQDMRNFWVNDGVKAAFLSIYVLANLVLFIERFYGI